MGCIIYLGVSQRRKCGVVHYSVKENARREDMDTSHEENGKVFIP